jgi:hypothetical protein
VPQILLLIAAGAGIFFAGRWYAHERRRIAAELRAAEEAMERESVVSLEQDPSTGVYRPKRSRQGAGSTRH